MKWKPFPHYWPCMNSMHLITVRIGKRTNNTEQMTDVNLVFEKTNKQKETKKTGKHTFCFCQFFNWVFSTTYQTSFECYLESE